MHADLSSLLPKNSHHHWNKPCCQKSPTKCTQMWRCYNTWLLFFSKPVNKQKSYIAHHSGLIKLCQYHRPYVGKTNMVYPPTSHQCQYSNVWGNTNCSSHYSRLQESTMSNKSNRLLNNGIKSKIKMYVIQERKINDNHLHKIDKPSNSNKSSIETIAKTLPHYPPMKLLNHHC